MANYINEEGCAIFRTVMVYEDDLTLERALVTCNLIKTKLGRDFIFKLGLWSFKELQQASLVAAAASAANEAMMIFITARGTNELPPAVQSWIAHWHPRKADQPTALVVLIGCCLIEPASSPPILSYLKEAAVRAHLDFFSNTTALPAAINAGPSTPALRRGSAASRLKPSIFDAFVFDNG